MTDTTRKPRFSARKSQAIYDAVHEVVMQFRIELYRSKMKSDALDAQLAQMGQAAARAASSEYRKPLNKADD